MACSVGKAWIQPDGAGTKPRGDIREWRLQARSVGFAVFIEQVVGEKVGAPPIGFDAEA